MTGADIQVAYNPILVQARHWLAAARRLRDMGSLANASSWQSLGKNVMMGLQKTLSGSVEVLEQQGMQLLAKISRGQAGAGELERFKQQYLQVEMLLDFYADAITTRTGSEICTMLRACDYLSEHSMRALLEPLGYTTPAVVVYLDKGLGASIMKAGLRLWEDSENPTAAIKIVRHNLLRPTALVHEAGHQVAHLCGWNDELARLLRQKLADHHPLLAKHWSNWASEIAADLFAFAHTGFASVAALHDVVDGPSPEVFRFISGDPHPISFLRVMLGITCCQEAFGNGVWDEMAASWRQKHNLAMAKPFPRGLIEASLPTLPGLAQLLLHTPLHAFRKKSLAECISIDAVHPRQLANTARQYGSSFYTSAPQLVKSPLLRLAWNGYQLATATGQAERHLEEQKNWMLLLGKTIQ